MSFRGTGASQTFDSLNNFILKGEPAQGLGLIYDTLLDRLPRRARLRPTACRRKPRVPRGPQLGDLQPAPRGEVLRRRADHRRRRGLHLAGALREGRAFLPDHAPGHRQRRGAGPAPGEVHLQARRAEPRPAAARRRPAGPAEALLRHGRFRRLDSDAADRLRPYVVAAVQPGKSISYCRNPGYWGKDLPVNVGRQQLRLLRLPVFRRQQRCLRGAEGRRLPVPRGVLLRALGHRLRFPGARRRAG